LVENTLTFVMRFHISLGGFVMLMLNTHF